MEAIVVMYIDIHIYIYDSVLIQDVSTSDNTVFETLDTLIHYFKKLNKNFTNFGLKKIVAIVV